MNFEFFPLIEEITLDKYNPFSVRELYIFWAASIVVNVSAGDSPAKASFKIASYFFMFLFKYVLPSSAINPKRLLLFKSKSLINLSK